MAWGSRWGTPWAGSGSGKSGVPDLVETRHVDFRELLLHQLARRLATRFAGTFFKEDPTLGLNGTHQGVEHEDGSSEVNLIGVAGATITVMKSHRRPVLGQFPGQGHDLRGRNPGLCFRPLGSIGCDEILKLGQAMHPSVHKCGIVKPFVQDDVHQCIIEGQVGTRADHPVAMRLGGGDRDAGVDVGHFGPIFHGRHQVVDLFDRNGLEDIAAIQHDMPGVAVINADLAVGKAEKRAAGRIDRPLAQSVMGEMIGRADSLQKSFAHMGSQLGPFTQYDTVATVLVDDRFQLVAHIVQGLVPTGLAPVSRTPFTDTDHRALHPLAVVKQ